MTDPVFIDLRRATAAATATFDAAAGRSLVLAGLIRPEAVAMFDA